MTNENLINEVTESTNLGENLLVEPSKGNLTKKAVIVLGVTAGLAAIGFGAYKLVKKIRSKKVEEPVTVSE